MFTCRQSCYSARLSWAHILASASLSIEGREIVQLRREPILLTDIRRRPHEGKGIDVP